MEIQTFKEVLKWCTVINIVLLLISSLMLAVAGDFIYSIHGQLFHMSNEAFNVAIYSLLGGYKVLILVFNLVPYVALRIVDKD